MKKAKAPTSTTTTNMEKTTQQPPKGITAPGGGDRAKSEGPPQVPQAKNLAKTQPLSRSQDNLASTLRKKAAAAALAGNKENKDRANSPKFKTAKPPTPLTPIRKAHSSQSLDKCGTPIKRAQSAQNISKSTTQTAPKEKSNAFKKSASTHNISNKGSGPVKQRNMNSQHIMAYNAELLASFEKEKKALERRISELIQVAESRKTEIEKFKFEVKNLKEQVPSSNVIEELELLRNENKLLKDKLNELGIPIEHSTDSEKLSALRKRNHDALLGADAASIASTGAADKAHSEDFALSIGDISYITPDHPSSLDNINWDKVSQKSGESEVSVACLQDRILQMEETHYSTNEELQATLQELTDLQHAVNELSDDNQRFADEKQVLLESLCAQTVKLENCRMQIEHLKALLVNESDGTSDRSENEKQLASLLKSSQEEREEFLLKQVELMNSLQHLEQETKELKEDLAEIRAKCSSLQLKNESLSSDKKAMEGQISELKEQTTTDQIELQRYKTLLDNERQKVSQLEQFHNATDKSEVESLLHNTRMEKEKTEERLANVQEDLSMAQNHVEKLQEQVQTLSEDLKVSKNNCKTELSNLQDKMAKKDNEREDLQQQLETLRDHIDQLQLDCDRFLEEKKTHNTTVNKLEGDIKVLRTRNAELDLEANALRQKYAEEQEEWKQFHQDLQRAVRIAHEFKVETMEDMEKVKADENYYKEKSRLLEEELLHAQDEINCLRHQYGDALMARSLDLRGKVISTVDRELAMIRQQQQGTGGGKVSKDGTPILSVKNLIQSIEKQVKSGATSPMSPMSPTSITGGCSRRNSTDSIVSTTSSLMSEASPKHQPSRRSSVPSEMKGVLRKTPDVKDRTPKRHTVVGNIIYDVPPVTDDAKVVTSPINGKGDESPTKKTSILKTSILKEPTKSSLKRSSVEPEKTPEKSMMSSAGLRQDPLANLAKQMGGSKRNALLKWCQSKTLGYKDIDITNFSSSWNDGLAFCALLNSYLPDSIKYRDLSASNQEQNFTTAFNAADSVGIPRNLSVGDMVAMERPDWQAVMNYVTNIYKHFEVDKA